MTQDHRVSTVPMSAAPTTQIGFLEEVIQLIEHDNMLTPTWALPVLRETINDGVTTVELHVLRSLVRLVRTIMERSVSSDIEDWATAPQLPEWGRMALARFVLTGHGFEKNRLLSECDLLDRLITERLGFGEGR